MVTQTYLGVLRLVVSPGLGRAGGRRGGRSSLNASLGLSRVAGDLDPILLSDGGAKIVGGGVPLGLGSGIGSVVADVSDCRSGNGWGVLGVAVGQRGRSTGRVDLGQGGVCDSGVRLDLLLLGRSGSFDCLGSGLGLGLGRGERAGMGHRRHLNLGNYGYCQYRLWIAT